MNAIHRPRAARCGDGLIKAVGLVRRVALQLVEIDDFVDQRVELRRLADRVGAICEEVVAKCEANVANHTPTKLFEVANANN